MFHTTTLFQKLPMHWVLRTLLTFPGYSKRKLALLRMNFGVSSLNTELSSRQVRKRAALFFECLLLSGSNDKRTTDGLSAQSAD